MSDDLPFPPHAADREAADPESGPSQSALTLDEACRKGSLQHRIPPRAVTGLVDPPAELPIAFDPVPRLRKRRDGWSEATQRTFIDALARSGSVTVAAEAVGRSARSAYKLLEAPGADSFAEAWDQAVAYGIERLRWAALDRAIGGSWVPVMRRGRIVRTEYRHNDRLAIALLSGRTRSVVDNRERAASRRRYRLYLAQLRAEEAEEKRQADAVSAEHQAILDGVENAPRRGPRIRRL